MPKLLTGLAAIAALVLFASAGLACEFHEMNTAVSTPAEPVVAMTTYDGTQPVPVTTQAPAPAAVSTCPADAKDCAPPQK